jgi:branched-chain amino acid transport system permease protein
MKNLYLKMKNNIYSKFGLLFVIMALMPLFSELDLIKYSTVSLIAYIVIFTIVAMGLNILLGFSGLMSLGTAGFVGFGAYGVVYFSNVVGMPYELAALITIIIASIFGAFIGLFSLKVEGVYLAISTLAVGEVFSQIFKNVTWFTNAFGGVHYQYPKLLGLIELNRNLTYLFLVVWMVIMMIVMHHITKSKTGRAMMAMSRSKSSAQAMGVRISKYKMISFLIATVYATLGGVLYASFYRYVQPLDWNLMLTLLVLAMVVVGGMKSIFGTFLGVIIIYGVPKLWLEDLFTNLSGVAYIFSGILIIVVVMFYPYGLIHLPQDIKKLISKWKLKRGNRNKIVEESTFDVDDKEINYLAEEGDIDEK